MSCDWEWTTGIHWEILNVILRRKLELERTDIEDNVLGVLRDCWIFVGYTLTDYHVEET